MTLSYVQCVIYMVLREQWCEALKRKERWLDAVRVTYARSREIGNDESWNLLGLTGCKEIYLRPH